MSAPIFEVGDKVVCVDATYHPSVWEYADGIPQLAHIYTISEVYKNCRNPITGVCGTGYTLEELRSEIDDCPEVAWGSWHFKALAEVSVAARHQPAFLCCV